jgi:ATP-dependent DNA helicase RecG
MTPEDLGQALGPESDRVERKRSASDADTLLRAACALANDLGASGRPGFLVLGMNPDDMVVGVDATDDGVQRVVNRLTSTKIIPTPSLSVEVLPRGEVNLLIVRIEPYPVPPVVRVDGVAWVRIGNETRRASDADIARLEERRPENRQPFDTRLYRPAALSDLDTVMLRQTFQSEAAGNHDIESFPDFEKWLGQRDLARHADGRWVPTPAGLLAHGIDPQRYWPGAVVEFARYAGPDVTAQVVSRKLLSGSLGTQLEGLWAQIQANLADLPGHPDGIRTPYVPEYPIEALKELARNMVQHRTYEATNAPSRVSWYDDRVEFTNPGGPFGRASEGEFGDHSDYRNPTITRLLVEQGYVEKLGRGVRLVRAQLERNGNPPLEVATDGFTTVTVRRHG